MLLFSIRSTSTNGLCVGNAMVSRAGLRNCVLFDGLPRDLRMECGSLKILIIVADCTFADVLVDATPDRHAITRRSNAWGKRSTGSHRLNSNWSVCMSNHRLMSNRYTSLRHENRRMPHMARLALSKLQKPRHPPASFMNAITAPGKRSVGEYDATGMRWHARTTDAVATIDMTWMHPNTSKRDGWPTDSVPLEHTTLELMAVTSHCRSMVVTSDGGNATSTKTYMVHTSKQLVGAYSRVYGVVTWHRSSLST
ncbi:hypothetical protein H257_04136 [Aphanomyces astaci]|uniref:Uncharacterized protein n=1 Tax=Aphanomyces astaci TaxID=112090 RepID=W4GWV9_APHAT|nr:hypothetical protein H257_04136 [Aphanomyces astaci]ETV83403.1 hypothetical protein H257_04136 [Aphanomyces astaci]|eukprot:XP_009826833.1 hypothetical protein H257_04136 [Aphanomyces astaci]